jgi:hypothetical protein
MSATALRLGTFGDRALQLGTLGDRTAAEKRRRPPDGTESGRSS